MRLFSLAAWGPKTQEQQANRKQEAVLGVASVLLGEGQLMADERVVWVLLVPACVGVVGASLRIPRAFFATSKASALEPKQD